MFDMANWFSAHGIMAVVNAGDVKASQSIVSAQNSISEDDGHKISVTSQTKEIDNLQASVKAASDTMSQTQGTCKIF